MGKTTTRKSKSRRHCPIGVNCVGNLEENEESRQNHTFATNTVFSVIEKLQSSCSNERECAACTIANMADHPLFIKCLLDNDVIKIAAPLMVDRNIAVRHAVTGAMRNLSVCGGQEVSQAMIAQDVMSPLVGLFNLYNTCWEPAKSNERIDSPAETFLEACNLLWNLCENSNEALSIFNDTNIISILLPCLSLDVFGIDIPLAVAQCLHVVAEDNPVIISQLSQPLVLEQLLKLLNIRSMEPAFNLLSILVADIMLSIFCGKTDELAPPVVGSILNVINHIFVIPFAAELQALSEEVSNLKTEKKNKHRDDLEMEKKIIVIDKAFKDMEHLLNAKQVALEVLTNICFGGENDEWDDISNSDNSDELPMDVESTPSFEVEFSLNVPPEIYEFIVNHQLLDKVLNQIHVLSEDVEKKLKQNAQGNGCLKRLHGVRFGALLCINNLVQGMNVAELGGPSRLFDIWISLSNLAFKKTDSSDIEQLEAATSSLRAVLQKVAENDCSSLFCEMTELDIAMLTNICQQTKNASIKVNIIQAIATLGCILGNIKNPNSSKPINPNSSKAINMIGTFLMESCTKNSELWVIAEALDGLMDVFAEDHLDAVAKEIFLVEKLSSFLPHLKAKIRIEKKSLGEHLPVIRTAKTNLIRFITYKKEHCEI